MAEYISSLTGPQMDEALMDMAQHTSEAWAVGTRGGTPVSSTDPTYNNNAKWYSQHLSEAGRPPYIGENGNWYEWSSEELAYVDTGVTAHGDSGTPAEVLSTAYAVSQYLIPRPADDQFTAEVPTVPSGYYLWVRNTYNTGYKSYVPVRYGINGEGAGDMLKETYDPDDVVQNAGGIVPYVDAKNTEQNAVSYTSQSKTDAQKAQARENINAVALDSSSSVTFSIGYDAGGLYVIA